MKKNVFLSIFLFAFSVSGICSGFDIKTSPIIDQPGGVEVLGDYKGSWYVIGFEKPENLNKPRKYKLLKYNGDFHEGKSSAVYESFGEKTIYLRATFINNKIALFYGRCDSRRDENDMLDKREGHRQIPVILRQDYDPNTLLPIGKAQVVFDETEDHFSCCGIDIAESEDKSKNAVLLKCYYRQQKYKVIMTDNVSGKGYTKVFDLKPVKEFIAFQKLKISNAGQILFSAKVRNDVITLTTPSKDQKQILYYVFHIEKTGASVKYIDFAFPISRNKYIDVPVIEMLSNGSMLIAYGFFSSDKSNVVKGISISKYDSNFNLLGTNEIVATTDLVALASTTPNAKKENGFPFLELQQVLPLESGGFMLIAEYHRVTDNADKLKPSILERNYIITYRVDDKLVLKGSNFIPKKQSSSKIGYALSTVAYHKGNEVYLVHNDDWTSDAEHDTNLQRTWISAKGTAPETTKITHTSDDFFTSMEHIYLRSDGKILLTEEKLVEFENVSREIKLLEVTPK